MAQYRTDKVRGMGWHRLSPRRWLRHHHGTVRVVIVVGLTAAAWTIALAPFTKDAAKFALPVFSTVCMAMVIWSEVERSVGGEIPVQHVRELHRYAKAHGERVRSGFGWDRTKSSDVVAADFRAHFSAVGAALAEWSHRHQEINEAQRRIHAKANSEIERLGIQEGEAVSLLGTLTSMAMGYLVVNHQVTWEVQGGKLIAVADGQPPATQFQLASARYLEPGPFQKAAELQAAIDASVQWPDVRLIRQLEQEAKEQGVPLAHDLEIIEHSFEIERADGCASCARQYLNHGTS